MCTEKWKQKDWTKRGIHKSNSSRDKKHSNNGEKRVDIIISYSEALAFFFFFFEDEVSFQLCFPWYSNKEYYVTVLPRGGQVDSHSGSYKNCSVSLK